MNRREFIKKLLSWAAITGIYPVLSYNQAFSLGKEEIKEAKPDRWWWIELAKKMGWGDIFKDEWKDHEKLINFACGPYGFSVEDFLREEKTHALRAPKNRKTLFTDGKFHTKNGKFWFFFAPEKFKKQGISVFPEFYIDPDIAEKGEKTIKYSSKLILSPFEKKPCLAKTVKIIIKNEKNSYPLYLITGRPSSTIMGNTTHWSKLLVKYAPDQICVIHPEVAKKLKIKNKEKIKVISPYGKTEALAIVSKNIKKDTVFIPYSYGENQPFSSWKSVNFITHLKALCPISGQIAFKGIKVKIAK